MRFLSAYAELSLLAAKQPCLKGVLQSKRIRNPGGYHLMA